MVVQHMLSNAAVASQHIALVDDPVVVGALLRSIVQWMQSEEDGDLDFLIFSLKGHPQFHL